MWRSSPRVLAAIMGAIGIGTLQGCALTECLEYRDQVVTRQVCDRYSDTGSCASSHTETGTQSVCVKRAQPGEKRLDHHAAFEQRMDALKSVAKFPPSDFDSCVALDGEWYGECMSEQGGKCMDATRILGRCASYIIPHAQDESSCIASGASFQPACRQWSDDGSCSRPVYYGTCRQPLAFEDFSEIKNLVQLDRATRMVKYPEFMKPGLTWEDYSRQWNIYADVLEANGVPRNHAVCTALSGSWYGACVRAQDGRCVEASRTKGLCVSYVHDRLHTTRNACYSGMEDWDNHTFVNACLAYRPRADGTRFCVAHAHYGWCKDNLPSSHGVRFDEYVYLLKPDGTVATTEHGNTIPTTDERITKELWGF